VNEIDDTIGVSTTSTWVGGICGIFEWGPVGELMTISSANNLGQIFGNSTDNNYETWLTTASFLAYSDNCLVGRAANTITTNTEVSALNAIGNTATANLLNCVILNPTDFSNKIVDGFDPNVYYIARYPGSKGNSLRIAVCDTAAEFSSNLSLSSVVANATFTMNVGSNVATIVAVPVGNGVVTDANTLLTNILSDLSVGDLILLGNVTISTMYGQVTALPTTPSINSTAAFISINFFETMRLKQNVVMNGNI
jgi:hypothetical protein